MISPTKSGLLSPPEASALFTRPTAGAGATVAMVSAEGSLRGLTSPVVSVPVAVAVSVTEPWSTSAWVTV